MRRKADEELRSIAHERTNCFADPHRQSDLNDKNQHADITILLKVLSTVLQIWTSIPRQNPSPPRDP